MIGYYFLKNNSRFLKNKNLQYLTLVDTCFKFFLKNNFSVKARVYVYTAGGKGESDTNGSHGYRTRDLGLFSMLLYSADLILVEPLEKCSGSLCRM